MAIERISGTALDDALSKGGTITWDFESGLLVVDPANGQITTTGTLDVGTEFLFTERADHDFTPAATRGILWVRSDTPNVLVFTDDAGTDWDLSTASGDVTKVGTPADNQIGVWTGDGTIEGGADLTWDGTTFNADGVITANDSITINGISATLNIVSSSSNARLNLDGPGPQIRWDESDGGVDQKLWELEIVSEQLHWLITEDDFASDYIFMTADRSGTGTGIQIDTIDFTTETDFTVNTPSVIATGNADIGTEILFTERSDHAFTPVATRGILWVRDDAPNNIIFTDDGGTDHRLNSTTVNLGEFDLAVIPTVDENGWPDNVEWFVVHVWDLDLADSANHFTLRLYQPGASLVISGYDSDSIHDDGTTRTFTNDTAKFDTPGFNGLGIVRGYMKGTRTSAVTDTWAVEGFFIDLTNSEILQLHGHVDLTGDINGVRIQSDNAANFTAGTVSISYGF